ncbi:MAG: Mur ligase family protein [Chlamydiota bacterium]|nr:Mur ligase family protein [Chlamydiota bacterium]
MRSPQGVGDLSAFRQLMSALGNPQEAIPMIHVGGTNGKGSVVYGLDAAIDASVGRFISPHLFHWRERITIRGNPLPDIQWRHLMNQVMKKAETLNMTLSWFEALTAIAFLAYAEGAEVGVIEVGMGGLHDPTNVVNPLVTVITSVGEDHLPQLGPSLSDVARQKGGIIKPGVPLVLGPSAQHPEILSLAEKQAAPLTCIPPHGDHRQENIACVEGALQAIEGFWGVCRDWKGKSPPYRYEQRGKLILDVAHNPPALRRLMDLLLQEALPSPFHILFACRRGAPVGEMLNLLTPYRPVFHLFDWRHPLLLSPKEILPHIEGRCCHPPQWEAMQEEGGLITGSCYMMQEVEERLGALNAFGRE